MQTNEIRRIYTYNRQHFTPFADIEVPTPVDTISLSFTILCGIHANILQEKSFAILGKATHTIYALYREASLH